MSKWPIQVTFSEKGTKIAPKTHIRKFEILDFSVKSLTVKSQSFFLFKKI